MVLGPLRPGHRGRVLTILRDCGMFRSEEIAVALQLFDAGVGTAPESADPDYRFLGAFTPDDELAGYVCYGPVPGTDATWDIYWIAVHPGTRRVGGGTTLMRDVESGVRAQGARLLAVETSSTREYSSTRRFYRSLGYSEAARVREFYAPGDDRIIFTKRLDKPAVEERHTT